MKSGQYDLNDLIAPHQATHFLENHWGRRYLHVARTNEDYFKPLLSLRDFDEILTSSDVRYPGIRMARDGDVINSQAFARQRGGYVDISQVMDEYGKGATVILESLHRSWIPIIQLVRKLELQLQFPAQANAYLTPKNAQGFAPHSDSHDVLILQIEGSKCWQLYQRIDDPSKPSANLSDEELGTPVLETVLHAGDILYIPKGQVHQAKTSNEASLHITLGIHSISWYKLMQEVFNYSLHKACEQDVSFHQSLSMSTVVNENAALERWQRVIGLIQNGPDLHSVYDRLHRKSVRCRQPWLKGQLLEFRSLENVNQSSKINLRPDLAISISIDETLIHLIFDGKAMKLPLAVEPHLRYILKSRSFVVNDIPDTMDEKSKLVLVRRLVKEGLLTVGESL